MKKVIKNGQVAVLYSPGFGAGWYSWNSEIKELLFDPDIVQAVLDGDKKKAEQIAKEKYPDGYYGGAEDLEVEWINEGEQFEIDEYDRSESIHIIGGRPYIQA